MKFSKKRTRIYNPGLHFPRPRRPRFYTPEVEPQWGPPSGGKRRGTGVYMDDKPKRWFKFKKKKKEPTRVWGRNFKRETKKDDDNKLDANTLPMPKKNRPSGSPMSGRRRRGRRRLTPRSWTTLRYRSTRRSMIATTETGETTKSYCKKIYSKRKNAIQRANPNTQTITGEYKTLWGSNSGRKQFETIMLMTTKNQDQFGQLGPDPALGFDTSIQPSLAALTNAIHKVDPPDYATTEKKTMDYYYSIGSLTNTTHITNTSNSRLVLTIRNLVARRDLPTALSEYTPTTLGPIALPVPSMIHGWRLRQIPNGTQSPETENSVFDDSTSVATQVFYASYSSQSTYF